MPPRLSIMCTSHASRVQGTTGLPCSSEPWWLRTMCSSACAVSGGKPGQLLDGAADAVVAQRDLALQAPGIGEVDGRGIGGVGLELADVVQQRAGDRHVAIDAGEGRGHRAHALGDREAVLEQPVHVGLVVELGRRRAPVELPRRRVRAQHADRAARAGAGPGRWRRARAPRSPSSRPSAAGRRRGRRRRTSPGPPRSSARSASCAPAARVDLVAAAHVDRPAGLAQLAQLGHVVAHDGREPAAAVAEGELEELRAVAPRAQLGRRARAGPGPHPVRR